METYLRNLRRWKLVEEVYVTGGMLLKGILGPHSILLFLLPGYTRGAALLHHTLPATMFGLTTSPK